MTPQTDPELFRIQKVGAYEYDVPTFNSVGLQEDIAEARRDATREFYRKNHASDLTDGVIDEAKYSLWLPDITNAEEIRAHNKDNERAVADFLFLPRNGAPKISTQWYRLDPNVYEAVLNFTVPTLPDNTSAPLTSVPSGGSNPASEAAEPNLTK